MKPENALAGENSTPARLVPAPAFEPRSGRSPRTESVGVDPVGDVQLHPGALCDALAVEMEGYGFLRSVRMNQSDSRHRRARDSDCYDKTPE